MAREIPTWLDGTPDGVVPSPPIVTRAQSLPFNDLTWENFERLILRLVRREARVLDCVLYGVPGQAQGGIDVLAAEMSDSKRRICYQCKKVLTFDAADIRAAVDRFVAGPFAGTTSEFVLCSSRALGGTTQVAELDAQRERLNQLGISFVTWDGSDGGMLCEKLKLLPDLVDDFFSRPWVTAFNGDEAAAALGARLNAVEIGKLRPRLSQLYSILFNQHDPGPLTTSGHSADYLYRYVMADVFEEASAPAGEAVGPGKRESPVSFGSKGDGFPASEAGGQPGEELRVAIDGEGLSRLEARKPMHAWLSDQRSCVVLGEPGYGKSTMLRHLAISLLRQDDVLSGQFDPQQLRRLPAWMSFAGFTAAIEKNRNTSVSDYICSWLHRYDFDDVQALFQRALEDSEVLILVDGLDEATTAGHARIALDRLVLFAQAKGATVICTSRPRGFDALGIPRTWGTAHLAPFSDGQIRELGARWFALSDDDTSSMERFTEAKRRAQARGDAFLAAVTANSRTHQLARTPLLCQTLIELFRKSPRLPEERVAVYGEIVSLILSRHPGARARAADEALPADYGEIGAGDIRKMLVRLAKSMQSIGPVRVVSVGYCEAVCAEYLEDDQEGLGRNKADARRQAKAMISDLVGRFGALVERAPQELGFVHLSIQEFLAAEATTAQPESEQLEWVARVWKVPDWRESLVNWFGLQGLRGKKVFAGQAAAKIRELGNVGEFERMQALQLCTDLACADLGIPVGDARRIVQQAAEDVEQSAFTQHRAALARSLTGGALGSAVSHECAEFIRKWTPGRPPLSRARCLTSLGSWRAAEDLRATLIRGILDEDGECRRAASRSLAAVFPGDETLLSLLRGLALHHLRPEVRAAALRALGYVANWAEHALMCANENLLTVNSELLFEAVRTRVSQRKHDSEDLSRMSRLWMAEAVDFWQRHEFTEVLLDAWPSSPKIRETFLDGLRGSNGHRPDSEEQLIYLMRAYPGDDEIARLLARRFLDRGLVFGLDGGRLWPSMRDGFRGHPTLVPAIRQAIRDYKEEHKRLFWHPNEIGAYMVLGDDEARDELVAAYGSGDDPYGNYWIARTLSDGWPADLKVAAAMKTWATGTVELAAPLATWSRALFDNITDRQEWLVRLATEGASQILVQALRELLDQFPDEKTLDLVRARVKEGRIWYYHLIDLESKIAAISPRHPDSLSVIARSLTELDGPPISPWARAVEDDPALRARVLAASTPAPSEVRMVIANTLRVRMADHASLTRVCPEFLAEVSGAVRATNMSAFAQVSRGDAVHKGKLGDLFVEELTSSGTYHSSRRRSALASLLEMHAAPLAAEALVRTKAVGWTHHLVDMLDPDPVSLNAIVGYWQVLRPLLEANGLPNQLPINEIVSAGHGGILDQSPELKAVLDEYLHGRPPDWREVPFFELMARRFPRSELLCTALIEELANTRAHHLTSPAVARLLAQHFGSDPKIWERIKLALAGRTGYRGGFARGVLGYLACGWRDDLVRAYVHGLLPIEGEEWGMRDRLLLAIADGDSTAAEQAAESMLVQPFEDWRYKGQDVEALRMWASEPIASEVLLKWSQSENATVSMTAISLSKEVAKLAELDLHALHSRFNMQCQGAVVPSDGLDAVLRRVEPWCAPVYEVLLAETSH